MFIIEGETKMLKTKRCPICGMLMMECKYPHNIGMNTERTVWQKESIFKCQKCSHMEDLIGNIIFEKTKRNCPICKMPMEEATYPKEAKSIWAGHKVFKCNNCRHCESKRENDIPWW